MFISNLLGVRREGATHAACHLQEAGLIQYACGHFTIFLQIILDVINNWLTHSRRLPHRVGDFGVNNIAMSP